MATPKHILVIRLSAMGDVAMLTPVLRNLVSQYPDVKITVLSRGFLKPLFEDMPRVSFYEAKVAKEHKGILGLWRLSRELKKLHVDAIADTHHVLRSTLLRNFMRFSVSKQVALDKGRAEKKALTREKDKVFKPLKKTHKRYADVFEKLGLPIVLNAAFAPQKPVGSLSSIAGKKGGGKWIGIAPFAQYASKTYPLDLMRKVLASLDRKKGLTIFLFGGGDKESQDLELLAKPFESVVSIAGKAKLTEELALISNLDVMLAMDSGNAHFAAMYGVSTVTLWGGTHPYAGFAPFLQDQNCIVSDVRKYPSLPCSVYGNKTKEGYEDAMRTIAPEGVVSKIVQLLQSKSGE